MHATKFSDCCDVIELVLNIAHMYKAEISVLCVQENEDR